jgi:cellulose synthase/poly-beta-1,6-N-acetylglucosamine synthase-like glycosyltransferase
MKTLLENLNKLVFIFFFCCYAYQFLYIGIRLFKKMPIFTERKSHKYAVLIAARNESQVIEGLIKSIRSQNYPKDLLDIFVVADNCTDNTATVARRNGAKVFVRNDLRKIGKGFALDYAFKKIDGLFGIRYYEGYLIFDADNVLDVNFVKEINKVFDEGYEVVTSYRNSKNYGYNWISSGYALWFLRESKYLNGARMLNHTSCAISGTGFLVSSEIIQRDGGWKYDLMTEDIEFTVDKAIDGHVIGYCETAVLFDEQPIDFKTSWNQRMRWTKGFYQVFGKYGKKLFRGIWSHKGFQCYDMLATIAPAAIFTLLIFLLNAFAIVNGLISQDTAVINIALMNLWASVRNVYLSMLFFGLITTITEWRQIRCSSTKKILYLFTFPIFMFTYVPIAIAVLFKFKEITWVNIEHTFQFPYNESIEKKHGIS